MAYSRAKNSYALGRQEEHQQKSKYPRKYRLEDIQLVESVTPDKLIEILLEPMLDPMLGSLRSTESKVSLVDAFNKDQQKKTNPAKHLDCVTDPNKFLTYLRSRPDDLPEIVLLLNALGQVNLKEIERAQTKKENNNTPKAKIYPGEYSPEKINYLESLDPTLLKCVYIEPIRGMIPTLKYQLTDHFNRDHLANPIPMAVISDGTLIDYMYKYRPDDLPELVLLLESHGHIDLEQGMKAAKSKMEIKNNNNNFHAFFSHSNDFSSSKVDTSIKEQQRNSGEIQHRGVN